MTTTREGRPNMSITTIFTPAEVFSAGEYLRDELEERGWTVREFAEIIDRPIQAVSEILNGKKEITTETACAFADALGTSPDLWLNLQTNYRLHEARRHARNTPSPVARRARLRNLIPLAKARSRGWVPDTEDLDELEHAVCTFLEIASIEDEPSFAVAARRSNSTEPISPEQLAWLAHVRSVSRNRVVDSFNPAALEELASELPNRTAGGSADLLSVPEQFAQRGVIIVFSEGLPGGKLDGAVTFREDGKPVIGLTTRGDRFDSLLFTMLHECAHLTLGHIGPDRQSIVDDDVTGEQTDPREAAANDQASAWMFPGGFTVESASVPAILQAATRYEVHPSVVIGQVQRQTQNWSRYRTRIPKVKPLLVEAGLMS
jgi:HTH-type transcriptional regulator / antitoxin HigA